MSVLVMFSHMLVHAVMNGQQEKVAVATEVEVNKVGVCTWTARGSGDPGL